ncbi:MAG: SUMF1/EgtB/PvdO family nonheme iron enzyme [Kiritimatiellae bacterium]|nr:SUMF1/EgtB/PvdO family nonheme iron enzyme [Kiritimatiellia bacterium]
MTKLTRWAGNGLVAVALGVTLDMVASAASVTIDRVVQRWPWNNKVDITYTVTDAQKRSDGDYYALRFALTANGQTYAFEGSTLGASAETGGSGSRQYTVTWTAPEGIVCTDASLTATLFATNVPSGNDYMVVDLDSGAVFYEGLCASQADSNERYNTAEYKEDKLVLRKVPRTADSATLPNGPFASGYPTGDSTHYSSSFNNGNDMNLNANWTTDRDYYIGVFLVTQYQYRKLRGDNPSAHTSTVEGNVVDHRPVDSIGWNILRGSGSSRNTPPVGSSASAGTFLQRLNFITGNNFGFDLPTEVMFEIAARAGATTTYAWGNDMNTGYVVCSDNAGGSTVAVGSRLPNAWGLYDTFGNTWDVILDGNDRTDLSSRQSAFTASSSGSDRVRLRGGNYSQSSSDLNFHASRRNVHCAVSDNGSDLGFRVSVIVQ